MVFVSSTAVKVAEILETLQTTWPEDDISEEVIKEALATLEVKYRKEDFSFELRQSGGGYQFLTKSDHHKIINLFLNQKEKRRLSGAALETLSIIAYKQPVTKTEIEQIRGVNCDYTVQRLLDKDLIEICGKKDAPGRPLLYEVSQSFLDYFGINSTEDLPKLKDLMPEEQDNTVGSPVDIVAPEEGSEQEQEPVVEEEIETSSEENTESNGPDPSESDLVVDENGALVEETQDKGESEEE